MNDEFVKDLMLFKSHMTPGRIEYHRRGKKAKRRFYMKHHEKILLYAKNYRMKKKQQEVT